MLYWRGAVVVMVIDSGSAQYCERELRPTLLNASGPHLEYDNAKISNTFSGDGNSTCEERKKERKYIVSQKPQHSCLSPARIVCLRIAPESQTLHRVRCLPLAHTQALRK